MACADLQVDCRTEEHFPSSPLFEIPQPMTPFLSQFGAHFACGDATPGSEHWDNTPNLLDLLLCSETWQEQNLQASDASPIPSFYLAADEEEGSNLGLCTAVENLDFNSQQCMQSPSLGLISEDIPSIPKLNDEMLADKSDYFSNYSPSGFLKVDDLFPMIFQDPTRRKRKRSPQPPTGDKFETTGTANSESSDQESVSECGSNELFMEDRGVDRMDGTRYRCRVCSKLFAQKGGVLAHIRIHTGQRPFACEKCPRTFTQKCNLTRHRRAVHSGRKAYECWQCGRGFSRRLSLIMHDRQHELAVDLAPLLNPRTGG